MGSTRFRHMLAMVGVVAAVAAVGLAEVEPEAQARVSARKLSNCAHMCSNCRWTQVLHHDNRLCRRQRKSLCRSAQAAAATVAVVAMLVHKELEMLHQAHHSHRRMSQGTLSLPPYMCSTAQQSSNGRHLATSFCYYSNNCSQQDRKQNHRGDRLT